MKHFAKFLFADFETTGLKYFNKHGFTKVYLAGLTDLSGNFQYFKTINDFYDFLKDNCREHTIVYFHNLKFDFSFLEYFFTVEKIPYIKKCNEMGRIISAEISLNIIVKRNKRLIKREITIQFRDSLLLLNGSLDSLAKAFSLPYKIEKDKTFYDRLTYNITDEEIEYLKRDVEILKELVKLLFQKYNIYKDPPLTTPSLARSILFENCIDKDKHNKLFNCPFSLDQKLRPYYYGGFCYVNPKHQGKIIEDVSGIDVNSFYPSIMAYETLIYGVPKEIEGYQADDVFTYFYIVKINCELRPNKHPYILKKGFMDKNNYIIVSDGDIEIGLWDFEIEMVKSRYECSTFEILKSFRFSRMRENIFTNFLQKLYHAKQSSKGAEKQFNKLIINSIYGKYGQNQVSRTHIFTNFFESETYQETYETISYLPLAMYITAKARFILNTHIDTFGNNFVYCDTDSIYFKGKISNTIKLGDALGDWDLEHDKEKGIFLGQKIYKIGIMNKMVGLTKKAQSNLTFEDYRIGKNFTGVNLKQKRVLGGCILVPQDFQIKNRG